MIYNLEKTFHEKTPGLNTPETYVLTQIRFFTYLVLIFIELNKAQIYKKPYRDGTHHEIEIAMSFKYLNLVEPNEHSEDFYIRKPNDEIFLFQIGDKNISMREKK